MSRNAFRRDIEYSISHPPIMKMMTQLSFTFTLVTSALFSPSCTNASTRLSANQQTARYVRDFSRIAKRKSHGKDGLRWVISTVNAAQEHRNMWRAWRSSGRWPKINQSGRTGDKKWWPKPNATSVLRVSWYPYENNATYFEIDNHGRSEVAGSSYEFGYHCGSSGVRYFKPHEMQQIERILKRLPRSRRVWERGDLLMVSGRRDGRWVFRMYSRRHPPKILSAFLQSHLSKTLESYLDPKFRPYKY